MLDIKQLESKIKTTIKGKGDVILYGNKSSGKTTLCKKILDEVIGKDAYMHIKCLFISSRQSLLYLFGDELFRLMEKMSSQFMMEKKLIKSQSKFLSPDINQSIGTWLTNMNKLILKYEQQFKKIKRIYVFMDNIEEITLSEIIMKQFCCAIKSQLKHLKVSFIFSGLCHKNIVFNITQPFKNIAQYFMPRPDIQLVVKMSIKQSKLGQRAAQSKIFEKLVKHLEKVICSSFESIQYQTQFSYLMAQSLIKQVNQFVGTSPEKAKIWLQKNEEQEKQLLKKLNSLGPVTLERSNQEDIKKNTGIKQVEEGQATFYMENYPNLIMTSIGLTNGFLQSEDIKRFIDRKQTKSKRQKKTINKVHAETFKQDPKKFRHNRDRIIAISETLQSMSRGQRLKEKQLEHHTLDYYGCFQYLRHEGCINFFGRTTGKFGGTVMSQQMKESEVRDFLHKIDVDYKTVTGRD